MHIEIKQVDDEWVALCTDLDPRVKHPPLVTGKTEEECWENLRQWEKDRIDQGLTASDPPFKDERAEKFQKMAEQAGKPISYGEALARVCDKFYNEAFSSTPVEDDERLREMVDAWINPEG